MMNCRDFRERLVELLDVNPDPAETADLLRHMEECPRCAQEFREAERLLTALSPSHEVKASSRLKERIMSRVTELDSAGYTRRASRSWMKPARVVFATALLLALLIGGGFFAARNGSQSSAFAVLAEAAEFAQGITSMHISAEMRTRPVDNFDAIDTRIDLQPVEIWKEFGETPKWRVEKPGRVALFDGRETYGLISPPGRRPIAISVGRQSTGMIQTLSPLLDPETLFAQEQELAKDKGWIFTVEKSRDSSGVSKTILTIEAKAQGDFSQSDYMKNKTIFDADNTRVYTFDTETHRLEGVKIYVRENSERVLVFQTTKIEYNTPLSASLFQFKAPEDVIWNQEPSGPDNSSMTPKEVAEAIFNAMAAEDWTTLQGFAGSALDDPAVRKLLGRLKVVSIGEPFKSGVYPGWFVPYEVRLPSGETKKGNLAVRSDNPEHRWQFDGGL